MVDLNTEMADLWASLGTPAPGRARAVQFVAARRGEGTSTVAREFARFAARRAGREGGGGAREEDGQDEEAAHARAS